MKNLLGETSDLSSFWPSKFRTILVSFVASLSVLLWMGSCNTNPIDGDPKCSLEKVNPTDQENLKSAQEFYDRLLENKGKVIYRLIEETTPSNIVHYCFTPDEREAIMADIQEVRKLYHLAGTNQQYEWILSAQGPIEKLRLDTETIREICKELSDYPYYPPIKKNFFKEKAEE